jgi:hypothetical protein
MSQKIPWIPGLATAATAAIGKKRHQGHQKAAELSKVQGLSWLCPRFIIRW